MAKVLKKWNGRAQDFNNGHANVAAYTQKQAAELLSKAYRGNTTVNEVRNYFFQCWGNNMDGIEPTEPCVYHQKTYNDKPVRIL